MGDILVGTASWTDRSLIKSGWYPPGVNSAEARLEHYASRFPLVEVDSTYYFPPVADMARRWTERTPDHFVFNIKAFSLFTQHPTMAEAIPRDLPRPADKKRLYPKDLEPGVVDEMWARFCSALDPLHRAGKLGALLFQFPPWFTLKSSNKRYILDCVQRARPLRICVEFRNQSWLHEDNRAETIDLLEGYDIAYVCVDMPQGFRSSVPPVVLATSDLGVVRFHGRNEAEWESGSVQRRFAYRYTEAELEDWVPRLRQLSGQTSLTQVLMNNCHDDWAQRNGEELSRLLAGET